MSSSAQREAGGVGGGDKRKEINVPLIPGRSQIWPWPAEHMTSTVAESLRMLSEPSDQREKMTVSVSEHDLDHPQILAVRPTDCTMTTEKNKIDGQRQRACPKMTNQ